MSRITRTGVSLLEVLFAMLVATVGLLGALAILPVAIEQANKGRRADAQAVAGESAVNDFKVRGANVPERWVVHDRRNFLTYGKVGTIDTWYFVNGTNTHFYNYAGIPGSPSAALRSVGWKTLDSSGNYANFSYGGIQPAANQAFCFDPWGVARYLPGNVTFREFPSTGGGPRMLRAGLVNLDARRDTSGNPLYPPAFNPASGGTVRSADVRFAENFVKCYDELRFRRTEAGAVSGFPRGLDPPEQEYASTLRRQVEPLREFSWFATLVPKANVSDEYVLSTVVVNRRLIPQGSPDPEAERVITSILISGNGLGGGEMNFRFAGSVANGERQLRLATGDWVLLKGIVSGTQFFSWYRVIDTEPTLRRASGRSERYVTLYGGDWPVPAANTQAVIVTGVSAVYERTIRLQRSSLWQ